MSPRRDRKLLRRTSVRSLNTLLRRQNNGRQRNSNSSSTRNLRPTNLNRRSLRKKDRTRTKNHHSNPTV